MECGVSKDAQSQMWKSCTKNWKFGPFGGPQRPFKKIKGCFPKLEANFESFFDFNDSGLKRWGIKNL